MNRSWNQSLLSSAALLALFISGCKPSIDRATMERAKSAAGSSTTALYGAMESRDQDLALAILASGIEQKAQDAGGRTPLMVAARSKSTQVAWELLPKSAKNLPTDRKGLNALTHAARADEGWLVDELLKRGAPANFQLPGEGSLVAECLTEGRTSIATLLLDHGASVESQDAMGQGLLEIATRNGQVWMVQNLIERGASFEGFQKSGKGRDLVHVVAEAGKPELIKILAEKGADLTATNEIGENPIHIAIGSGSFDLLQPLHERGVSLDLADHSGARPVHLAVMRRDPDSLRALLRLGADPSSAGQDGKTALEYALEARDYEFASLLISYGAKVPGQILYTAISEGDRDLVDYLLSNGADPNDLGHLHEDTLLGSALRRNNRWAASRLLQAGAYPGAVTRDGQTAFHLAVAQLDRALVAMMLEKGADPNLPFANYPSADFLQHVASKNIAKSSLGHTRKFVPLMMAADSGDIELARLLIDHGAKSNVYTKGGRYHYWAPISWAARRADISMMQILLGREPSQVKRWAKIDLSKQRAWVYDGDEEIYSTRVSTGKPGHRTRTGTFVITNRHRHWNSTIYDSSMPYFQRFSCGDFGFHQGYVPGYAASHGCIRVPGGNVQKLWKLLSLGDPVKIIP